MSKNKKISIEIKEGPNNEILDVKLFGLFNEIDWAIIYALGQKPRSVGEITRLLKIAPVNVWKHLLKLKEMNVIDYPDAERGKKKIIKLKDNKLFEFAQTIKQLRHKIKK